MWKNIFWTKWQMVDLVAEPNWVDVWELNWAYYFTLDAAIREAKIQGLHIPTSEDWIALVWYCGWFNETIYEMELTMNWFVEIDENWCLILSNTRFWYYWASDGYRSLFAKSFEHGNIINVNKFRHSWFSVRCIN